MAECNELIFLKTMILMIVNTKVTMQILKDILHWQHLILQHTGHCMYCGYHH